jgi:hypothetical protein
MNCGFGNIEKRIYKRPFSGMFIPEDDERSVFEFILGGRLVQKLIPHNWLIQIYIQKIILIALMLYYRTKSAKVIVYNGKFQPESSPTFKF